MRDTELCQRILGLDKPWMVKNVEMNVDDGHVDIWLEHEPSMSWAGPDCGRSLGWYDHLEGRAWRHLPDHRLCCGPAHARPRPDAQAGDPPPRPRRAVRESGR